MLRKNGEIVLVDYKTDKVKNASELIEKYSEQLRIYKLALEKAIREKGVKSLYLFSILRRKRNNLMKKACQKMRNSVE